MAEESVRTSTEMTQPVIIDLGKQKSRALKGLKKGEGKLWDTDADGKVLVPIVLLYREKPRRRRLNLKRILSPFLEDN